MSNLSNAKAFGGIGALLLLIGGFVPLVGIVGLILVFVAVKYIADETKDNKIFHNYLVSFICGIIGIVALLLGMFIAFGAAGGFTFFSALETAEITDFATFWEYFGTIITGFIIALIVLWIFLIISSIYLRKSYNSIADHTKVNLFKTTGLLYLIGAITLIVVIGFLILFIARILEIVSFFSLPDNLPKATKGAKEPDVS